MENDGCLIWFVLIFVMIYGCGTKQQLDELKDEVKDLRNKPAVIQVEKSNESN